MRDFVILAIHLLVTLARFLCPGGVRAVAAESLSLKHKLLICSRSRQRATNLTTLDRLALGLTTLFMRPHRIPKLSAATIECGWSTRQTADEYVALLARVLHSGAAIRRAGSGALGLADVTAGRAEAYCDLHINAWDSAAGIVLVK